MLVILMLLLVWLLPSSTAAAATTCTTTTTTATAAANTTTTTTSALSMSWSNVSVDEFMVTMLDSENREIVFTACGVLINLMADDDKRKTLKRLGGIRK